MRWELKVRPPSNVCPERYCFHWADAGDRTSPPGRKYANVLDALKESLTWKVWEVGSCACSFGQCSRLDLSDGNRDWYEPHEPRLARDGLPWFYFTTRDCLRVEFHEGFIREAVALWGETALIEMADPSFVLNEQETEKDVG